MKHAHILLLLPCGMLPPLAGAQRNGAARTGSTSHRNNHPENKQTNQKQP